ncbi:uncharacterized protein I206_103471 [Kwoniella pini CBS 10737]|uniref:Myb-like domain-containing protein n=1 Tax=Kwoniella pini CBS 10737 TaxID=1296096 RepID=A0A1B9I9S2_9TREE|nr:uncharacterized protein I206_01526 [Kwoniella pini CBS 10737]OCF52240.1 hypothetical protein I206_01526 [Kwoniella pini CBS 10737]
MPKSGKKSNSHLDIDEKPYDRAQESNEKLRQSKLELPIIKSQSVTHLKKGKKQEYDKALILTLVLKTVKDIKWEELSNEIGKTPTQCKDVWRKVIQPSIISNKTWSNEGKDWTKVMKIKLLLIVLDACTPNWDEMTISFPGKTKSQLYDVWRKVILPRLKRGDPIE